MQSRPAVIAAVLTLIALPARAQLIDVSQPLSGLHPYVDAQVIPFNLITDQGPLLHQSFVAQAPTIVGGGFFYLAGTYLPGYSLQFSEAVFTLSTGLGSGVLAQTHVLFEESNVHHQGSWVDAFWAPVTVTPGQTYYLGIQAVSARAFGGPGHWTGTTYPAGSAWGPYGILDGFNAPPGGFYDYAFRTWTTVPEPSTYALMTAGLLALGAIARRRHTI